MTNSAVCKGRVYLGSAEPGLMEILGRMTSNADTEETDLGLHCLHICLFVRKSGVQKFSMITLLKFSTIISTIILL